MFRLSPLTNEVAFWLGPIPITGAVVTTWGVMAAITAFCAISLRRPKVEPDGVQSLLEILIEAIAAQIEAVLRRDPWPFMPLIGTLFIFLVVANLSAIVPGLHPPTGHIETPAALAVIVFFSVHVMGISARGLGRYLRHYFEPNPLLLPLNVLSEITRIFSLMVRLFGNMMSHEIVIAIVMFLAGVLVPIPFMLLGLLIGILQAYIFTVLATVFVGAAVDATNAA